MGRGLILSHISDAEYNLKILLDRRRIDGRLATIDGDIVGKQNEVDLIAVELQEKINELVANQRAIDEQIEKGEDQGGGEFSSILFDPAALIAAFNVERTNAGIPIPLESNTTLNQGATTHANYMREKDVLTHFGRDNRTVKQRYTEDLVYSGTNVVENIAGGPVSTIGLISYWLNSPGYKSNMLNQDYNQVGIGYAFNSLGTYGYYYAVAFGD